MNSIYIHMRNDWPDFRWDKAGLASRLAAVRHTQGRLLGRMEGLGFRLREEANLAVMTAEVVKSSAIEGEVLNNQQVRSSLARRLGINAGGTITASRAVEGMVEMMIDATRKYNKPLTSERLSGWHAALFPTGHSGMRKITVGSWRPVKAGPMQVVSGAFGREKIHFEAPDATRIPAEMKIFLEWFNTKPMTDPVIKAALAHFWFITLHPFEDGNGRIARAIADMALARSDGAADRFYSMSAQIEAERKNYYSVMEDSQKGTLDVTDWLAWFIECLCHALERADDTLSTVLMKALAWQRIDNTRVNDRQRKIINLLLDGFQGNLTTSKYAKLARCSNDTALRDIQELLDNGALLRNPGGGRSASYRLAEFTNQG